MRNREFVKNKGMRKNESRKKEGNKDRKEERNKERNEE